MIRSLFARVFPLTVDAILTDFTKGIARLEAAEAHHNTASATHSRKAAQHDLKGLQARSEARRAARVAAKLKDLVEG